MAKRSLGNAKKAKNDEFYTRYEDIQKEMNAYLEYNPDVFRDKTILLPCDDPEWSNFTKFFAQNFEAFGLKKLISTSYAVESKKYEIEYQPSLFEEENKKYDAAKTRIKGKIFTLDRDTNGNGKIDIDDLQWDYMEGDGDFNSDEVKRLRDEADIIITNPPFSLFRDFVAWIMEAEKKFIILGNPNLVSKLEIFPLIAQNKIWLGCKSMSSDSYFNIPESYKKRLLKESKEGSGYKTIDGVVYGRTQSVWYTNIEHGRRHQKLSLMTMADNKKFNKKLKEWDYQKFDNYDAIEISEVKAIPSDYDGIMGVPITFLDKYCPEQFEILGTSDNGLVSDEIKKTDGLTQEFVDNYYKNGGKGSYKKGNPTAGLYINGVAKMKYSRIFIRHKK